LFSRSPPRRKTREERERESTILSVSNLTRNVTQQHVQEIFGNYGKFKSVELMMDKRFNLSKGYALVEYETRKEAEEARNHMEGVRSLHS
jgi:RNA recognition motif-containing protein